MRGLFLLWFPLLSACVTPGGDTGTEVIETPKLRWNHTAADVTQECTAAQTKFKTTLDRIAKTPAETANFANSALALDSAMAEFGLGTNALHFYFSVSPKEDVRKAAKDCAEASEKLLLGAFTRVDLYMIIRKANQNVANLDRTQKKLLEEFTLDFQGNGLDLTPVKRAELKKYKEQLISLASDFQDTLDNWNVVFDLSKSEIAGLPDDVVSTLAKSKVAGKDYVLTLKYPHYLPAMTYIKDPVVRKRLFVAFHQRGGTANRNRMANTIALRDKAAHLLGFKTHAEAQLLRRMAKNPEAVTQFLDKVYKRLVVGGKAELAQYLVLKKAEFPKAKIIDPWDVLYYDNILLRTKYNVDNQTIKEYFPVSHVMEQLFATYQSLLGVEFKALDGAPVWHPSVKAYAIIDRTQGPQPIAWFYTDLFPRDGKYGHAGAFPVVNPYQQANGVYERPVSAIVANLAMPGGDKPALLDHDQVVTLFHEFGHIMHQTLTKVPFASLAGPNAKRDFVEAPSQMFENWVWEKETLGKISSHYQTHQPLPADMIDRMIAAKKTGRNLHYLRQIFFAKLDMGYHTWDFTKALDTTKLTHSLYHKFTLLKPEASTYVEASFAHLINGYDAGYYGYLWSEVYAADMFTRFKKEGLLSPITGVEYRRWILEQGGSADPFDLIKGFLGRTPNEDAFLKQF